jgi:hypothetical protein
MNAKRLFLFFAIAASTFVLGACADTPVRTEAGSIDVRPKANKNYIVDGEKTITFVELEQLVADKKPTSIVLEQSRMREGAACIVMLGLSTHIDVWTRTLNGRMHKVKADVKSEDVANIEKCR